MSQCIGSLIYFILFIDLILSTLKSDPAKIHTETNTELTTEPVLLNKRHILLWANSCYSSKVSLPVSLNLSCRISLDSLVLSETLRFRGERSCHIVKWPGSLRLPCSDQRGRVSQGKSCFLTRLSFQRCKRWN